MAALVGCWLWMKESKRLRRSWKTTRGQVDYSFRKMDGDGRREQFGKGLLIVRRQREMRLLQAEGKSRKDGEVHDGWRVGNGCSRVLKRQQEDRRPRTPEGGLLEYKLGISSLQPRRGARVKIEMLTWMGVEEIQRHASNFFSKFTSGGRGWLNAPKQAQEIWNNPLGDSLGGYKTWIKKDWRTANQPRLSGEQSGTSR